MDDTAKITALENEFHSTVEDMKTALADRNIEGVDGCVIHVLSLAKAIVFLAKKKTRNSQPRAKLTPTTNVGG